MTHTTLTLARKIALSLFIPTLLLSTACTENDPVAPDPLQNEPTDGFPLTFAGAFTSLWTRADVEDLTLTATSTLPVLPAPNERIADNYWVWDSWPVRTPSGAVARIGDWYVLIALTASDSLIPGARHGAAELRYLISRDGTDWTIGERLFDDGDAEGNAQWAGSTIYDAGTNRITVFYTAIGFAAGAGDDGAGGETRASSDQRIVMIEGTATATSTGIALSAWGPHRVILQPQGQYYEKKQDSEGVWSFRDPWYFEDPRSGRTFLLFTANLSFGASSGNGGGAPPSGVRFWPTASGAPGVTTSASGTSNSHGGDSPASGDATVNGVVGIAVATNDQLTEWRLLPPLLAAIGVNSQLERPHFILKDENYYLFYSSHEFTFADGLSGPDGLYGFVSDSLTGLYKPLNGTGLVAGNPTSAPFQTYSYLVLPNLQVTSYIGYQNLGGIGLGGIGSQTPEWQRDRFGGTLAPTFTLTINGSQTTASGFNGTRFILTP